MMIISAGIFLIGTAALVATIFLGSKTKDSSTAKSVKQGGIIAFAACLIFSIAILFVAPQYKVWQQQKEGEAELAKAEQNRQIAIQEARAKEEAAKSLANAEVIRAEGVAKANKIIGDSLQNNDAYIHYLWIEALRESDSDVIYIPTEAGIPITESARFFKKNQ